MYPPTNDESLRQTSAQLLVLIYEKDNRPVDGQLRLAATSIYGAGCGNDNLMRMAEAEFAIIPSEHFVDIEFTKATTGLLRTLLESQIGTTIV